MKVISHRGYWKAAPEKNTRKAFYRSFELGYGTETDVRDVQGKLVISHDMPSGNEIDFLDLLKIASEFGTSEKKLTLALNIKADGLAKDVNAACAEYPELDCFVFDMAIPDMRDYLPRATPAFTRMSEVEHAPAWLDQCQGVWLDAFESTWFDNKTIEDLLQKNKRVCVVSSELHRREHMQLWAMLKELRNEENLIICTDFPEEATDFIFE